MGCPLQRRQRQELGIALDPGPDPGPHRGLGAMGVIALLARSFDLLFTGGAFG
jgi:hypothetical protein